MFIILLFYSLGPRFLFGVRSCSSDFFSWPEAMRPMARSAASIEMSVVLSLAADVDIHTASENIINLEEAEVSISKDPSR